MPVPWSWKYALTLMTQTGCFLRVIAITPWSKKPCMHAVLLSACSETCRCGTARRMSRCCSKGYSVRAVAKGRTLKSSKCC